MPGGDWIPAGRKGLTICDATRVSELDNDVVKTYDLAPERYLGERATAADVAGGTFAPGANADPGRARRCGLR